MGSFDLRLGDCLDPVTGLASLPDKSVDVVLADPPYEEEAHTLQRRTKKDVGGGQTVGGDVRGIVVKPVDFPPMTPEERAAVSRQMARVTRRWILVFCQAEAIGLWRDALVAGGAVWKRSCIWVKPDGQPQLTGDRPGMGYESIAAAHAPGRSAWNGGGKHGVYTFATKSDPDKSRTGHPTQKPEALMEALVRDFTDPGELILDPYAGSGTTGVAAVRNGRAFIGWERKPAYHAAALARLVGTKEQLEIGGPKRSAPKQLVIGRSGT